MTKSRVRKNPAGLQKRDVPIQVMVPVNIKRQLKMLAASRGTTQRAIVLDALRLAGLNVPANELADLRGSEARSRQARS